MENSKKLIIAILMLMSVIVCLIVAIFIIKDNEEKIDSLPEGEGIIISNEIKEVTSHTMFYTVQNAIQKYLSFTHLNINEEVEKDTNENQTLAEIYEISTENEKKQAIIDFLDVDFIKRNNINLDNIDDFVSISTNKIQKCSIKELYTLENIEIQPYLAVVQLITEDENGKKAEQEVKYIITLDTANSNFMVEPIGKEKKLEEIQLNKDRDLIETNSRNSYIYIRLNDGEIAEKYFSEFKDIILNNSEEAYNLLNEDYRNLRFGNLENFKNYVEKNKQEISENNILKYLVNEYDEYTEYVCMDQYQNLYVFTVKAVKNYDVKMDTYTIMTENFKEEYDKSDDQKRIMLNIDKWVQMLNNRDYSAAYEVLDETFRNNKFGSQEKFEQFMREKLPLHYKVEFGEYSNETDVGIQKIKLTDITGENTNVIGTTIIMQLKDNYEFVMSLEV